jgi:hypothetical protein
MNINTTNSIRYTAVIAAIVFSMFDVGIYTTYRSMVHLIHSKMKMKERELAFKIDLVQDTTVHAPIFHNHA